MQSGLPSKRATSPYAGASSPAFWLNSSWVMHPLLSVSMDSKLIFVSARTIKRHHHREEPRSARPLHVRARARNVRTRDIYTAIDRDSHDREATPRKITESISAQHTHTHTHSSRLCKREYAGCALREKKRARERVRPLLASWRRFLLPSLRRLTVFRALSIFPKRSDAALWKRRCFFFPPAAGLDVSTVFERAFLFAWCHGDPPS